MSIVYLANKQSVHVARWLDLVAIVGISVKVADINFPDRLKNLKYIVLGLYARFFIKKAVLHAHSAAGYGTAALISGLPYILTVYGTEVFSVASANGLKRRLVQKVLSRARLITCTTEEMKALLMSSFSIPQEKIRMFSLGISDDFLGGADREKPAATFIHNRRFHPHYNIEFILEAFARLRTDFPSARLILISGDADVTYMAEICEKALPAQGVSLINKMLSKKELAELLQTTSFSISFPKSDQMSASILESMACGCVPVLAPLMAYRHLEETGAVIFSDSSDVDSLHAAMRMAVMMEACEVKRMRSAGKKYISDKESSKKISGIIENIYKNVLD